MYPKQKEERETHSCFTHVAWNFEFQSKTFLELNKAINKKGWNVESNQNSRKHWRAFVMTWQGNVGRSRHDYYRKALYKCVEEFLSLKSKGKPKNVSRVTTFMMSTTMCLFRCGVELPSGAWNALVPVCAVIKNSFLYIIYN